MRFHFIYYPCVLPKTLKWPNGGSWCPSGTRFFIIVEKQNGALLGYHLRSSRSFENMLRTRPIGVVSKKLIGLLITDLKRLLCKVDDDFRVNWRKKKLRIDNLIVYLVFTKSIVSTESLKLVLVLINTIFGFRKKIWNIPKSWNEIYSFLQSIHVPSECISCILIDDFTDIKMCKRVYYMVQVNSRIVTMCKNVSL